MQSKVIQEEHQLLCLLRALRQSMKGLYKHELITKPEWTLLDQAWHAMHRQDPHAFEAAVNGLDSRIHIHSHQLLGPAGAAQYRAVRSLIHCVQDVWPAFFPSH